MSICKAHTRAISYSRGVGGGCGSDRGAGAPSPPKSHSSSLTVASLSGSDSRGAGFAELVLSTAGVVASPVLSVRGSALHGARESGQHNVTVSAAAATTADEDDVVAAVSWVCDGTSLLLPTRCGGATGGLAGGYVGTPRLRDRTSSAWAAERCAEGTLPPPETRIRAECLLPCVTARIDDGSSGGPPRRRCPYRRGSKLRSVVSKR